MSRHLDVDLGVNRLERWVRCMCVGLAESQARPYHRNGYDRVYHAQQTKRQL